MNDSVTQPFEQDLLAQHLVNNGQLADARDHAAATGLSVIESLVELGHVTAEQILAVSGGSLAAWRPLLAADLRQASFTDADGDLCWVVNQPLTGKYLMLTERQKFILDRLDGKHTVAGINIELVRKFRQLDNAVVTEFLKVLGDGGFLEGVPARNPPEPILPLWKRLARAVLWTRFPIANIDGVSGLMDRLLGKVIWHPVTRGTGVAVIIAGFALFLWQLATGGPILRGLPVNQWLFGLASTGAYLLCLALHEAGHALTCKHYGLTIPDGGMALYLGLPCFYVNTTDCWLAPPTVKIAVTLSGSVVNLWIAGVASVLGLLPGVAGKFWLLLAAMNYLTVLVNLNPLGRFDGYYLAMDLLGVPKLRNRRWQVAAGAVRSLLAGDWRRLPRSWKLMLGYVLAGLVYTLAMIGLAVVFRRVL